MLIRVQVPSSAPRAISSVGRAPRLHRGCRRFESVIAHQGKLKAERRKRKFHLSAFIFYLSLARVAQLVERLSEKQEVTGSSPVPSTTGKPQTRLPFFVS